MSTCCASRSDHMSPLEGNHLGSLTHFSLSMRRTTLCVTSSTSFERYCFRAESSELALSWPRNICGTSKPEPRTIESPCLVGSYTKFQVFSHKRSLALA